MSLFIRQLQEGFINKTLQYACLIQPLSSIPSLSKNTYINKALLHTSQASLLPYNAPQGPQKWLTYNKKIFPPQSPEEDRRPAFVCHMRTNIKYSPFKMWYVASMVRGMSIEEAIKQLTFVNKKGAIHVKEVLLEAQKLAVEKHNVEYKSNLWVAESFATKGLVMKGVRRHAKRRVGIVHYVHCHYFVRLEEGPPPKHFYLETVPKTTKTLLTEWIEEMRQRRIPGSL